MTNSQEEGKPLFSKTWKGTYAIVISVLVVLITLFYLFTITFS